MDEARVGSTSRRKKSDAKPVDILLMDIEMPFTSTLNCTKMIRDYETQGLFAPPTPLSWTQKLWRLPNLALSANVRTEQVEQVIAAGMDDAIFKPFCTLELWPKMAASVPRCS